MAIRRFLIAIIFSLLCLIALAEHNPLDYILTKDIVFERSGHPYFETNYGTVARVNLDLSLDGGTNWSRRIAHGIDSVIGTNTYTWSFHVTPDLWTEHARIGVRDLWSSTTNEIQLHRGAMSTNDFAICGVRFVSPTNGQTVLQPSYQEFVWHEAGYDYVDIGVSTNGGASYEQLYTLASSAPTNSYSIGIIGYPTGLVSFAVVADSNLYHTITVNIVNQ